MEIVHPRTDGNAQVGLFQKEPEPAAQNQGHSQHKKPVHRVVDDEDGNLHRPAQHLRNLDSLGITAPDHQHQITDDDGNRK